MKTTTHILANIGVFLLMTAGSTAHAQTPHSVAVMDSAPSGESSADGEANPVSDPGAEIPVHPMDRIRTDLTKQLALLNKLSQITQVLTSISTHGPAILTLLDDGLTYEQRIRAVLGRMTPPPSVQSLPSPAPVETIDEQYRQEDLEEIRYEIAALRMQMESAGHSEHFVSIPEEPVAEEIPSPEWNLSADDVQYFQLPDPQLETSGRVALVAGTQTAELDVHDTVLMHGKRITLREIATRDDRVFLTFVEDGELTRIRFD